MRGGRLQDRVALVTGAGAGLGRATALHLAREGGRVAALSLLPEEVSSLRSEAAAEGLELLALEADVGDAEQVEAAMGRALAALGPVDLLINNAGVILVRPIEETSVAEWDRVLRTNLRGAFLTCRALVPQMKAQRRGLIVNVSSQSGVQGFAGESAYCPSKFGLEGLTKTLALELRPFGVWAVSVTPGAGMHTPMSETTYTPEQRATWKDPAELAPGFSVLAERVGSEQTGGRFDVWELAQLFHSPGTEIPAAAVG